MAVDPTRFNRLLDYRSRDALARMDDAARGALFDEIAARGPSEATWGAIVELFNLWPDGAGKSRQIDAANAALRGWDDEIRYLSSSNGALYSGPKLSALARLVRSIEVRRRDPGTAEIHAIVASPEASHLKRLAIYRTDIGDAAWRDLIAGVHLQNLEQLYLSDVGASDDTLRDFLRSANLPRLRRLTLTQMRVTPEVLDAVADAIAFPSLRELDLSYNYVRDDGVRILAGAPWLAQIEKLALADDQIRGPAIVELLRSPSCARLSSLDIAGNSIDPADRAAIAAQAQNRRIGVRM